MSRKNRALVIGVGFDTLPILEAINTQFQAQNATDDMSLLWCTERGADHAEAITQFDMPVNEAILNQLFYEKKTRTWSGPNWQAWGQALASNRMLGKLAVHHHLRNLHDKVLNLINNLSAGDSSRLNLYIIAHAYAPFASGMVIEIAYLLHRLALTRGSSVHGVLLLPGMQNDPLVLDPLDDEEQRLKAAIAYSLLRELHQIGASRAFYQNHHKDIALNIRNMSPFQTGDCYLVGGEQKEPYAPLFYNTACDEIALWVYLQTATKIGEQVPMTDNHRSAFSSFGIISSTDQATQRDKIQRDAIAHKFIKHLLDNEQKVDAFENAVQRWLTFQQGDLAVFSTTPVLGNENPTHNDSNNLLAHHDADYLDSITNLRLQEVVRSESAKNSADKLDELIESELAKVRNYDSMTLIRYQQITNQWQTHIDNIFQNGERELQDLLERSKLLADDMKQGRSQYAYQTQSGVRIRLIATFALLTSVALAGILFISGLVVQMIFWLLFAFGIIIVLPAAVLNRNRRNALSQFLTMQQDLLNLQATILEQRIKNAYNNNLKIAIERALTMPDGKNRIQHIREQIETLGADVSMNAMNYPDIEINELAYTGPFLNRLWETSLQDNLSPHIIRNQVTDLISQHTNVENQTSLTNAFRDVILKMRNQLGSNLSVNINLIPQQHQHRITRCVGTVNWQNIDVNNEAQDYLQSLGLQAVSLDKDEDSAPNNQSSSYRHLYIVRVRHNIPLAALLSLERYQLAYSQLCQIDTSDRILRFTSMFHSIRSAIAGLDVAHHRVAIVSELPSFVQIFVAILHHHDKLPEAYRIQSRLITDLAKILNVAYDSGMNYDELAGSLNSNLHVLENLIERAIDQNYHLPDYAPNPTWRGWLSHITMEMHPRISEQYADWEIWALDELRYILNRAETQSSCDVLAQMLYDLTQVENLMSVITVSSITS